MEMTIEQRVTNLEELMADLIRTAAQTSYELRVFKDEMREFKTEMRRSWGELSNKMGTMAEDLVAPSIPRILRTVVGCPEDQIDSIAVRVRRRHPMDSGRMQEFDVVAACGDYVLINDTKSSLSPEAVEQFAQLLPTVRSFFPEYADKKIIGAIASLYVDESLARYAERQGLIALGFSEDVMDVLNSSGFVPQAF